MKYTKDDVLAARRKDLVQWLRANGYTLSRKGKNWGVEEISGLLVRENRWKNFYTGQGGNTLDFLVTALGIPFPQAMEALSVGQGVQAVQITQPKKILSVPERMRDCRRVMAYLTKTRGIDIHIIKSLIKEGLLWQDKRGNCVFPLRDTSGKITGAMLRGTLSDYRWTGTSPGSINRLGWLWRGKDSSVLIFVESPIEAMSLKQLRPNLSKYHFVALGGLHFNVFKNVMEFLKPSHVIIALNSDKQARKAAEAFGRWLQDHNFKYDLILPSLKDWNDDLIKQGGKGG